VNIVVKTPALSVTNLNVHYGSQHALKNLSVDIQAGELIGVIGPNGAGKTSFIRALCGRVKVSGGILINGRAILSGHDRRSLIGLVPQEIGLYPQLTARENLDVIARLLGLKKTVRDQAVTRALNAVDMMTKADSLVQDLSGGMKRRINVAAAIMNDPPVIIFDEPTAGVDIPARDTVHRLARTLAEQGKAVILVTHELEQAEALCDKIMLLKDGTLFAFDTVPTLLEKHFGQSREVVTRFGKAPTSETRKYLGSFAFEQAELATIWKAETQLDETSFVSAFMESFPSVDNDVREISVRKPGLTALMHQLKPGKGSTL